MSRSAEPATHVTRRGPWRILFCHASAELYGADYVLLQLARHLVHRGHQVTVVLPCDGPLRTELIAGGADVCVLPLPVLRRQYLNPAGMVRYAILLLTSTWSVMRLARRLEVDLLQTNTAGVWTAGLAARLLRRPHYWQVMEIVERPRAVAWAMAVAVGRLSTRVFCISEAVRRHFLRHNPEREGRFRTVYHGVDLTQFDPSQVDGARVRAELGLPERAVVVLYAGRFSAWKGQDVFIRSVPEIVAGASADVRFIMLGTCYPGQERFEQELREWLAAHPEEAGRVHLPGFRTDLPAWMAAADVFVLPSKLPEPNATVLIGAMAMGLPCIGTNIGGTVETIVEGTTGLLVPPNDPSALARAVVALTNDPASRRAMGQAGRARAEALFSLARFCQTIEASYA